MDICTQRFKYICMYCEPLHINSEHSPKHKNEHNRKPPIDKIGDLPASVLVFLYTITPLLIPNPCQRRHHPEVSRRMDEYLLYLGVLAYRFSLKMLHARTHTVLAFCVQQLVMICHKRQRMLLPWHATLQRLTLGRVGRKSPRSNVVLFLCASVRSGTSDCAKLCSNLCSSWYLRISHCVKFKPSERWKAGGLADWKAGGLQGWRAAMLEGCKAGRLEGKAGGLEGWKES